MSNWVERIKPPFGVDIEILEESALAMAQATIQGAINGAGISKADLARRMVCNRSVVSRMLSGSHNLTIKTMARALAACGYEVRFNRVPVEWNWQYVPQTTCALPAPAGSTTASWKNRIPLAVVVSAGTLNGATIGAINC